MEFSTIKCEKRSEKILKRGRIKEIGKDKTKDNLWRRAMEKKKNGGKEKL